MRCWMVVKKEAEVQEAKRIISLCTFHEHKGQLTCRGIPLTERFSNPFIKHTPHGRDYSGLIATFQATLCIASFW
jgi:hypothetical protein